MEQCSIGATESEPPWVDKPKSCRKSWSRLPESELLQCKRALRVRGPDLDHGHNYVRDCFRNFHKSAPYSHGVSEGSYTDSHTTSHCYSVTDTVLTQSQTHTRSHTQVYLS